MNKEIDELASILYANRDEPINDLAIIAFEFFRELSKRQVIDFDILNAMLHDAGVE